MLEPKPQKSNILEFINIIPKIKTSHIHMSILNPNKDRVLQVAPKAGALGIALLLVCFFIVLSTYENEKYSYSIFNHFISELGHSRNSPFYWIFSIGLCIGGPALCLLIMGLAYHLESKIGNWAMRIGLISGVACFLVGVFPADLFLQAHMLAAVVFFIGVLITSLLFAIAIGKDKGNKIPMWIIIPSLFVVLNGAIFLGLPKTEMAEFLKDRDNYERPFFWLLPFFEWMVLFSLAAWTFIIARFLHKKYNK